MNVSSSRLVGHGNVIPAFLTAAVAGLALVGAIAAPDSALASEAPAGVGAPAPTATGTPVLAAAESAHRTILSGDRIACDRLGVVVEIGATWNPGLRWEYDGNQLSAWVGDVEALVITRDDRYAQLEEERKHDVYSIGETTVGAQRATYVLELFRVDELGQTLHWGDPRGGTSTVEALVGTTFADLAHSILVRGSGGVYEQANPRMIASDDPAGAPSAHGGPAPAPGSSAASTGAALPFWGVWWSAYKTAGEAEADAAAARSAGYAAEVLFTCDWSNLNPEPWYVVTLGRFADQDAAVDLSSRASAAGFDSYAKYSGDYVGAAIPGASTIPSAPAPAATPAPTPSTTNPVDAAGFWGLWDGGWKDPVQAEEAAAEARAMGLYAEVVLTTDWTNLNPEPWYVITFGRFESQQDADAFAATLVAYGYGDAYSKHTGQHA